MALVKNSYGVVDLQATCAKQQEEIDALAVRVAALEGKLTDPVLEENAGAAPAPEAV